MTRSDVQDIFDDIIKKRNVSVGIDKIGVKAVKRNGLDKPYVDKVYSALTGGSYNFTKYKELLQLKDSNKLPRLISIPSLRDRLFFKCVYEFYLKKHVKRSKFEKVIHSISKDVKEGGFNKAAKFDLSNFFNSIPHDKLEECLHNEKINKHIVLLLMKALKVRTVREGKNKKTDLTVDNSINRGVPQGIIIGNALAEIYAQQIDAVFLKLENEGLIRYHRFVDDILILYKSSNFSKNKIAKLAKKTIKRFDLQLQNTKTKTNIDVSNGFEFLGFVFKGNLISISNAILKKKEKKLERVIFDFARTTHKVIKDNYNFLEWKLNLEITGFVSNKVFYGWTSTYRFINDFSIFYQLDYLVKVLYKRAHLDAKEFYRIKSFIKAHNCIKKVRKMKTDYVPNMDILYKNTVERRAFLKKIYGIPDDISDEHVEELFNANIKKEIFEIERDLDLKYGL